MACRDEKTTQSVQVPLVLRKKQMLAMVGLSESTIYALRKAGKFPEPIQLSEKAMGWRGAEIEEWVATRAEKRVQAPDEAKGTEVAA